jgi:hypothetical protein
MGRAGMRPGQLSPKRSSHSLKYHWSQVRRPLGEQITNIAKIGIIGNLRNPLLIYPHFV